MSYKITASITRIHVRWRLLTRLVLASSCTCACQSDANHANIADNVARSDTSVAGTMGTTGGAVVGAPSNAGQPTVMTSAAGAASVLGAGAGGGGGATGGTGAAADSSSGAGGTDAAGSSGAHASGSGGTAAGSGAAGDAAGAGGAGANDTGTLPAVSDPSVAGVFTPMETDKTGPDGNYTIIAPKELGQGEIKNPIIIWACGAGSWPAIYQTLVNHFASHGFVVVAYNSTPQGPELTKAIDWIIAESTRQGSDYFGKVDTTKIAAAGQSAGSLAVFKIANDPRLTTTLHINGGTFAPHTDVMNLVKPAQFICGDDPSVSGGDGTSVSDEARPNCDIDFMNATTPVWYGDVIGASHTTVIDNPLSAKKASDDPLMKQFLAATVGWLRWQLADDRVMKALFVGPSCGFCTQTMAWKVQQKMLH